MKIKKKIKLMIQNHLLHKKNALAQIKLLNCFNPSRIDVGIGSYGEIEIICFNNNSKIKIGCYCSIAQNVKFIIDADHSTTNLSTYPFKVKLLKSNYYEALSRGDIVVGDDVWIGYGATIMGGVHIGQGAVIAAGAVVTKDVPPYAIVGGVPGKIIRYRFSEEIISVLIQTDFSKLTEKMIRKNLDKFYTTVKSTIDVNWFYELTRNKLD